MAALDRSPEEPAKPSQPGSGIDVYDMPVYMTPPKRKRGWPPGVRDSYQRGRPKKGSDFTHPLQVQDTSADIIEQVTGISRPAATTSRPRSPRDNAPEHSGIHLPAAR